MPKTKQVYAVLIASPGDCAVERDIAEEVIQIWNASAGKNSEILLHAVRWEIHVRPELGDRPQAIIDKQIVSGSDILIGIFWTRFGSDTGLFASGTAEEISIMRANGKHVMVYFSSVPADPHSIDSKQLDSLKAYKNELRSQGIFHDYYKDHEAFRAALTSHLASLMADIIAEHRTGPLPRPLKVSPLGASDLFLSQKFAASILVAASEVKTGKIQIMEGMGGITYYFGERQFSPDLADGRLMAKINGALKFLGEQDLIDVDGPDLVLNERGWAFADELKANGFTVNLS